MAQTRQEIEAALALVPSKMGRKTATELRVVYEALGLGHGYGTSAQVLRFAIECKVENLRRNLKWWDECDKLVAECVAEFGWDGGKLSQYLAEKGLVVGYDMRNKAREVAAFTAMMQG